LGNCVEVEVGYCGCGSTVTVCYAALNYSTVQRSWLRLSHASLASTVIPKLRETLARFKILFKIICYYGFLCFQLTTRQMINRKKMWFKIQILMSLHKYYNFVKISVIGQHSNIKAIWLLCKSSTYKCTRTYVPVDLLIFGDPLCHILTPSYNNRTEKIQLKEERTNGEELFHHMMHERLCDQTLTSRDPSPHLGIKCTPDQLEEYGPHEIDVTSSKNK
jgi:hypothetical protein